MNKFFSQLVNLVWDVFVNPFIVKKKIIFLFFIIIIIILLLLSLFIYKIETIVIIVVSL